MIIVVNSQFYGVHGIARYIDSYLANLPSDSSQVVLITSDEHKVDRKYDGVVVVDLPIRSGRFGLFLWSISARKKVIELCSRHDVSCVNFHWPPLIPGLFLPKVAPIVLTCHTTYLGMSGKFNNPRLFIGQWGVASLFIKMLMERFIFSKVAKVLTLTEQGRQEVLRYGYGGEIVVIPNGADTVKFAPLEHVNKEFDVIFSGRIERRKGSQPMISLCKTLINKKPDIRIAIVGYGDDEEMVRDELSAYPDNVCLKGKVPFTEMKGLYARSKVYVSTSFYEGLPGTCLEAMAMELPVVVFDLLFYKGLVIPDHTGYLYGTTDLNGMSDGICQLIEDSERLKKFGQAGRRLLQESYSWNKLGARVQRFLES